MAKNAILLFSKLQESFNTIPRSELHKRMIEMKMPLCYKVVVTLLYEQDKWFVNVFLDQHVGESNKVSTLSLNLWSRLYTFIN